MLNLLFISDSPKAEYIKSVLQPVLKVIIDVVTDFDHGLKDVFEKRPTTVCIQDHIGGVTGESVARHIQMLLGNSAPMFILLQTGVGKGKAIKGLYEHVVDLSQANDTVAEDIKRTLKSLLGDQWDKIFIPPKMTPETVRLSASVPDGTREDADKLVDDILSDLENSGFSAVDDHLSAFATVSDTALEKVASVELSPASVKPENDAELDHSLPLFSTSDEMTELLLAESGKPFSVENSEEKRPPFSAGPEPVFNVVSEPGSSQVKSPATGVIKQSAFPETALGKNPPDKAADPVAGKKETKSVPVAVLAPKTPPVAEFRIRRTVPTVEEHIPEDLLLAFEENYRSESLFLRRSVTIALVCVFCATGGWYLVKQKPQLVSFLKQKYISLSGVIRPKVKAPVTIPVQKTPPPVLPQPVVTLALPAFIPKDGRDTLYSDKNPGWERYIGKMAEFRLYRDSGRIQAVQVLAVNNATISESLMKSVLQEFAGSQEYQITSRSTKAGVRVESGRIRNAGEIKIYRKNRAVKALVVSVN